MDAPQKMWSPSGQETRMDEFRKRVNTELNLTLSEFEWNGLFLQQQINTLLHATFNSENYH